MTTNVVHCRFCNASFSDVLTLSTHETTHKNKSIFPCKVCEKEFTQKNNLQLHINSIHRGEIHTCSTCYSKFNRKSNKQRHERICGRPSIRYNCPECSKQCMTSLQLQQHVKTHTQITASIEPMQSGSISANITPAEQARLNNHTEHPRPSGVSSITTTGASSRKTKEPICGHMYNCRRCQSKFPNRRELYDHGMNEHYQTGSGRPLQQRPFDDDTAPWLKDDGSINVELKNNYDTNAPIILQPDNEGSILSRYNVPITNNFNLDSIMDAVQDIYLRQRQSFRINISFGLILRNNENNEYRYYRAYRNADLLPQPFMIVRHSDLLKLRSTLDSLSLIDHLLAQRPNTKYKAILATNIVFNVYSTNYPVCIRDINLPSFIKNHHAIIGLDRDNYGRYYNDYLCLFRCLSLHRGGCRGRVENATAQHFGEWLAYSRLKAISDPSSRGSFNGIDLTHLPDFEECFQVNVNVMTLNEDRTAHSIYLSRCRFDGEMYINLFETHFSFITNVAMYCKRYQCDSCKRLFDRIYRLKRHQSTCSQQTRYKYPGGFFRAPQTLFEELEYHGIHVDDADRIFPFFVVFDFESMLEKVNIQTSPNLTWEQKHVPISVSICSNVPGFKEPKCIIEPELDVLVSNMVSEMRLIAERVKSLAKEKWGWIKSRLKVTINQSDDDDDADAVTDNDGDTDSIHESGEEAEESKCNNEDDSSERKGRLSVKMKLKRLYTQIKEYIRQVPVLGFNSAKYDMNLIKQKLARHLDMHSEDSRVYVVKRNNEYTCLSSKEFRFLDVTQYLAPGISYDKFLKAYDVEQTKGYFPYDFLDNVEKLDITSLPAYKEFYSTLKNSNITPEQYQYCQHVWIKYHMTTFRDFLVWYNNLDVGPFVTAVERLQIFYFVRDLDVFKNAISVPGIARKMIFRTAEKAGANFALFDEPNKDLYHTIKNNIVGGPSVISCRHAKVGQTFIRNNPKKPCQKIIGDDANALYLSCIGQDMPVGAFIRRRQETGFRPERRDKWLSAYHWMDYLNVTSEADIKHKFNYGMEKRVGKYPVDGWDAITNTIYQYHGCYFHGHDCGITQSIRDETWRSQKDERFKRTVDTTNYLRKKGYNIVEKWECEFRQDRKNSTIINDLIVKQTPAFLRKYSWKVTEGKILEGVSDGVLFGMLEVDIEVPEQWEGDLVGKINMTLYEYFKEMSPLFCSTEIPFEVIGTHMQSHAESINLSKKPRRLLVGGMKASQILIATPLLRWYLSHGLKVTKVYQVVEYLSQTCFKEFVNEVSDARRIGDVSADKVIIADTMKLIGNSGYGSLIMDKTKHRKVSYVQGERNVCLMVNKRQFRKLDCLEQEEEFYEVEMSKNTIVLNLPIQLGYFILQYAKLRMLEYYYDFLDVYVDRSNFEYLEMDTDSAYYAISGHTVDAIIKPEMRQRYLHGLNGFCNVAEVTADTEYHWFPRKCCTKHSKYDKRTPGLFKTEYEGDEMIALCSKTYIVRKSKIAKPSSTRLTAYKLLRRTKQQRSKQPLGLKKRLTNEYKFSCKGISKRFLKAPMYIF